MSNKTVVLKGAELWWARLDKPVSPFGTSQWELQVRTSDKAQAKGWKDEGINVRENDDDNGKYFFANLKRKAIFEKTGEDMSPPVVVDGKLMPLEASKLGNGSVGNVQVLTRPYEFGGRKGISVVLKAVQVTKLIEYQGSSGLAFEEIGDTEIATDSTADSEGLWD